MNSIALGGFAGGGMGIDGFAGAQGAPVPPVVTGAAQNQEAGTGTITNILAGDYVVIKGPVQTPYRIALKEVINVQASGAFRLDYQFTTDFGTTWYTGRQIASATSAADGTAYTNRAHAKWDTGYFYRIVIYNSGASPINAIYDKRFIWKGSWGS